jgi:DNA polymerase-3 subunit alpha
VLPPDVNGSETDFAPAPGDAPAIRYGLSAVRNVGEGAVTRIIDARRADGAFTSFSDFCRTVDPGVLTKRVLESLVQAGAFDSLGYTRQGLLQAQDKVSGPILAERKAEAAGQFSLFGGAGTDGGNAGDVDESVLDTEEFDKRSLLRLEKEMLGQFVTDHPLLEIREALSAKCSHEIADLDSLGDGDLVTIGGIIGAVARKYTKRGEPYAQFRLEGLAGGVDVVAFPSVYETVPGMIETDRIVLATGRIDLRGRELQIRATEVREPDLGGAVAATRDALVVDLPATACTPSVLARLRELFEAHPGGAPVRVRFLSSTGVTPLDVGTFRVHPAAPLLEELRSLLGADAARVERDPGADVEVTASAVR